ncbi:MAG TPA: beta-propeller fold lactonase family protein [Acidimicrobiales bacterium]|jgi:6-phosphogluconolactonase (cycloisomerase 2 family)|nr:beta-propeller fold lactonase family protein [Acidimicrobiales bacterium]
MKLQPTLRAASATVLTLGIGLFTFTGSAGASAPKGSQDEEHALFLETDASSGNAVLSYHRATDGTISFAGSFTTGGNGATAAGATADPLASQGGLTLVNDNKELIATNPGSDTVSVFSVDGTRLDLVQQISSQGLFPDSVATFGKYVAVVNAGGAGSVAEFTLKDGRLVLLPDQVRSLGLTNTTPPEFHHSAGQVSYSPDGQHLVITTKLSTNAYDVFSVGDHGTLGSTPVVTPAVNALPFSFVFDSAGNVVSTEASNSSVTTYRLNGNGTLTSLGTVSDGAAALCWISTANGYFFGSNAGSATLSSFNENAAGAPQLVNATAASTHAGTTDSVVSPDAKYLYVESGGAGTVDAFAVGATGSLTPIETLFNIPTASEGIAAS